MALRLSWSPMAKYDLHDIAAFIGEDNPSAAESFINKIFHSTERLTDFPESGRIVPEFNDPIIREIILKPFRIVFRVNNNKNLVEIIRVWHSARGIPKI